MPIQDPAGPVHDPVGPILDPIEFVQICLPASQRRLNLLACDPSQVPVISKRAIVGALGGVVYGQAVPRPIDSQPPRMHHADMSIERV